jgi:iron complex outermembrane receptor protein
LQSIYTVGPVQVVGNVGKVKGTGAEATLDHAFNENWTVGLGVSWFDSEATGVQPLCDDSDICEGASLPWAPEWTGYMLVGGDFPISTGGSIFTDFRWSVESDRRTGYESIAEGPSIRIDGYDEAAFAVGYQSAGNWRLTAYVSNVFDNQYFDGAADGGEDTNPYVNFDFGPNRPRTFGLRMLWKFD